MALQGLFEVWTHRPSQEALGRGLPLMSKRHTHSPEFKARVAMEAISGRKTIQVSQWKCPD